MPGTPGHSQMTLWSSSTPPTLIKRAPTPSNPWPVELNIGEYRWTVVNCPKTYRAQRTAALMTDTLCLYYMFRQGWTNNTENMYCSSSGLPYMLYVLPDDWTMALPGRSMELHMELNDSSPQHTECYACLCYRAATATVVIVFRYSF